MKSKTISADEFVQLYKKALREYEAGGEPGMEKGAALLSQVQLDDDAHPMLHAIRGLAWDVVELEGLRSEDEKLKDWQKLTRIFQSYQAGNWSATIWRLAASYERYENDDGGTAESLHGYSVVVTRSNGVTLVAAAESTVKNAVSELADGLNAEQTEEWYLRNLAHVLPKRIGDFRLVSSDVSQGLA